MRAVALAVLAAGLALPATGLADTDARALFADSRFAAAAASFEKQFGESANLTDGMNAVVAWRAAGRYAHARVLLQTITARRPVGELASRAQLLTARLTALTGTLTLAGVDRPVIVKVDGAPAERLGDDVVADVGIRDVSVEAEGCEPTHRRQVLRPTEHVTLTVKLACTAYPGSLHVALDGGHGAVVYLDGARHEIKEVDLDLPVPTGSHHLIATRRGIAIADEEVVVASKATARRTIAVPWRAKSLAFTGALSTVGHGRSDAQASLVGAAALGAVFGLGERVTMVPWFELGYAANHVVGVPDSPYLGVGLVTRVYGPLVQRRFGSTLMTLDLDPLAFHFGFALSGAGGGQGTNVTYWNLGAATLTVELPHVHLEAQIWPAGWATDSAGFMDLGTHFASELSLSAGWAFEL